MAAHAAGCAGGVLDGMCMKGALPTRERVQPPAFARGLCASARGAERAGWIDEPVICGGVIVYPGDIVLGDCDGVVIVPAARALEIVERSAAYQSGAAADREQLVPYWQGRDSERKLREIPGVEFP